MGEDAPERTTQVHDAVLVMDGEGDERAPGAAVTLELCGSWEHAGACPVAAHHTTTRRDGAAVSVRVLFAVQSGEEGALRHRVVAALAREHLVGPDGTTSRWRLVRHAAGTLRPDELEQAARLAAQV